MAHAAHPRRIDRAMLQIRIHGRGGQGVVTAAELLSVAAFLEGRHAQAFPSFGSERTGAPVVAFCRIDDRPIRSHEPIAHPDALIVQDPTLLHQVDVFGGLRDGGAVVLNTGRPIEELGLEDVGGRVAIRAVPATELAREHLGRPIPSAALLGAFAAWTGAVTIDAVAAAIRERFSGRIASGNVAAAQAAHDRVAGDREEAVRA
jgi:pyruvate ferredoxin oxidoreductase gamma subunit